MDQLVRIIRFDELFFLFFFFFLLLMSLSYGQSELTRQIHEDFGSQQRCWRGDYIVFKENTNYIVHFIEDFEKRKLIQQFTMSEKENISQM